MMFGDDHSLETLFLGAMDQSDRVDMAAAGMAGGMAMEFDQHRCSPCPWGYEVLRILPFKQS
jgi:hypothetical protein